MLGRWLVAALSIAAECLELPADFFRLFASDGTTSFDARWDLLLSAEVLAIDELDEFSATPWATERFLRLVDERWRHMGDRLTLFATNAPLSALPGKVASRLEDGRAYVVTLQGRDYRPFRSWAKD